MLKSKAEAELHSIIVRAILRLLIIRLFQGAANAIGIPPVVAVRVMASPSRFYWWFRRRTFTTQLWWDLDDALLAFRRRWSLLGCIVDLEPHEIEVVDKDRHGNVEVYKAWIKEFSEADVRDRTKELSRPVSTEESRRGRSSRGRDSVHVERIRLFNFKRGVEDWTLSYPEDVWDPKQKMRVPHPRAGEIIPRNDETYWIIPERIMDQIQDAINDLNEPPEIPEERDEEGNVIQPEVQSPLASS